MSTRSRFRFLLPLLLPVAACAADGSASLDDDPTASATSALTVPVCGTGEELGAGKCKTVPPVNKPPGSSTWAPFVVDGVRTPSEYFGAVKMPYSNPALAASGGNVYVSVDQGLGKLHVFAENLPGALDGELRVYLDYDRFHDYPDAATWNHPQANDRAFGINLATGATTVYSGKHDGTSVWWAPVPPPAPVCIPLHGCIAVAGDVWSARIGRRVANDGTGVPRFDVEYEITMPASVGAYGTPDGVPAIGFAIAETPRQRSGVGAFPEELGVSGWVSRFVNGAWSTVGVPSPRPRDLDRSVWQTLRFGTPRGVGLDFATWNIKRFTTFMHDGERLFSPEALNDWNVPAETIGEYAAGLRADVIALEEAWDHDQVITIRDRANAWRAAHGLPPYFLIGTIDYASHFGWDFDDTQGGVFFLSVYPATRIDTHAFSVCRGEDCLKRKGVLHARLNFGATSVPGPNELPASGDQFIDVYATHLQADDELCGENHFGNWLEEHALESLHCISTNPLYAAACGVESLLNAGNMNCHNYPNDAYVRGRQLDEMNDFIEATADKTRPSIVMGDFNLNGRQLGASTTYGDGEYTPMLDRLHLMPAGAYVGGAKPSDALYPWSAPYGVPGTIEHADVIRSRYTDDQLVAYGRGTFIGPALPDDGPMGSTEPPLARLDYILVRQPVRPGAPGFDTLSWMVGAGTGNVWESPFPASSSPWPLPPDTVGGRYSDHKPVLAHLSLIPMTAPPRFHADWQHEVKVRVTSANATTEDDCWGCGDLDLYSKMKRRQVQTSGEESATWDSSVCDGQNSVSVADGCTGDWVVGMHHDPARDFVQGGGGDLWESDDFDDDHFGTVPFGVADLLQMNWTTGRLELRDYATASAAPCLQAEGGACKVAWSDKGTKDNATRGVCTRTEPPFMCLELEMTEVPPAP